jgi:flagellar export protein FliJ
MTLTPQRLKRLVTQRERLERIQEGELAEAQRLHQRRQHALHESREQRESVLAAGAPARGPIDPADFLAGVAYLRRIEREIGARQAALAHSESDVAAERAVLLERRRDRKAMEALLDKRLEEARIARSRADIKRIDELATNRWRPPASSSPNDQRR